MVAVSTQENGVRAEPAATAPPPGAQPSLRKNFSWTLLGNLVYAGCQGGWLILLAKFGTPEGTGEFIFGLSVAAPIMLFSALALRGIQATDSRGDFAFGDYCGLRVLTTAGALGVIGTLSITLGLELHTALVLVAVAGAKAVESLSDVIFGLLQRNERMDRIAVSMCIKGPLSLVGMGLALWITGDALWGAVGLAATWLVVLVTFDLPSAMAALRDSEGNRWAWLPRWHRSTLIKLVRLAFPLAIATALVSLNTNIVNYFTKAKLGLVELGFLGSMVYLIGVGLMIVTALGQAATPRMAKLYAAGDLRRFYRLLGKMIAIGALGGVVGTLGALLAGRPILTLLFRPEYAEHVEVFAWLMVAGGVVYVGAFLGFGVTATRAFHRFVGPYLMVTLVAIAASALLIPRFGLLGAAWAVLAVNLASCLAPLFILITTRQAHVHGTAS